MADAMSRYYATNVSKRFLSVNRVYGRVTRYMLSISNPCEFGSLVRAYSLMARTLLPPGHAIFTPDIRGGVF